MAAVLFGMDQVMCTLPAIERLLVSVASGCASQATEQQRKLAELVAEMAPAR